MILAVFGSVIIEPRDEILKFLKLLFLEKNPNGFVSGGAEGVDTISESLFKRLFPYREIYVYEPIVRKWDHPKGFKWRNKKIGRKGDEGVCIRHESSESYGSGWTADYMEGIGKPVTRYTVFLDYKIKEVTTY